MAKKIAKIRQIFLDPLGPRCLETKSLTAGRLDAPAIVAPTAAMPAIALRRVAADILENMQRMKVDESEI